MATSAGEIYKCLVCGIIAQVLEGGAGDMICCGRVMQRQNPQSDGPGAEFHLPHAVRKGGRLEVTVGQPHHPSQPGHFIHWIEILSSRYSARRNLGPDCLPQAEFEGIEGDLTIRALCNRHGLWQTHLSGLQGVESERAKNA